MSNSKKNKKLALFGGSNSVKKMGLKRGLDVNYDVYNYSLGASSSLQNLYELIRNFEIINTLDFVVTESNVNDFHSVNILGCKLKLIENNVAMYYEKLSTLKIPVLVILLPLQTASYSYSSEVNAIHYKYIKKYGFNVMDLHKYYLKEKLNEKLYFNNLDHPPSLIMYNIGKYIDYDVLEMHEVLELTLNNYLIFHDLKGFKSKVKKNTAFCENIFTLSGLYDFPPETYGYKILGVHTWSNKDSIISVQGNGIKISKKINNECQFHDYFNEFYISDGAAFLADTSFKEGILEKTFRTESSKDFKEELGLIAFFLVKSEHVRQGSKTQKYNDLTTNFTHINDALFFMEEYYTWNLNKQISDSLLKKITWKISNYIGQIAK
tara:strand:+ start:4131 stop:5267 length:1137 start_codon:yes stop_codon:yes gene_type:complete